MNHQFFALVALLLLSLWTIEFVSSKTNSKYDIPSDYNKKRDLLNDVFGEYFQTGDTEKIRHIFGKSNDGADK